MMQRTFIRYPVGGLNGVTKPEVTEITLTPQQRISQIKALLMESDSDLARIIEDIVESLPKGSRAKLPKEVTTKIERRKALRAQIS